MSNTYAKKLLLAVFSTILSLLFAELYVRCFVPVRNVGQSLSTYDPHTGKRLKKNFTATRLSPEFTMHFRTNSLGMRGAEPEAFPEKGILFLGDSFTMGYGVDDDETFSALMKRRWLDKAGFKMPVLNAGVGNTGNGVLLKFLESEAGKFKPRLVVLQLSDNDFYDNVNEKLYSLAGDGSLIKNPVPLLGWKHRLESILEPFPALSYSYLLCLIREKIVTAPDPGPVNSSTEDRSRELTFKILEESLALCRQNGWPAVVLSADMQDEDLAGLQKSCELFGVQLIQTPRKERRPDLYFEVDGHWNKKGHAHVAGLLLRQLNLN